MSTSKKDLPDVPVWKFRSTTSEKHIIPAYVATVDISQFYITLVIKYVEVGTVFRLNNVVVHVNMSREIAVEARLLGENRCRIGFLPRMLLLAMDTFDGKLGRIEELKSKSESGYERQDSYRKGGIAKCLFLEEE
jgi:hypothetical protein